MLNKINIEYLERENTVRKRLGLALDSEHVNKYAFLDVFPHAKYSRIQGL